MEKAKNDFQKIFDTIKKQLPLGRNLPVFVLMTKDFEQVINYFKDLQKLDRDKTFESEKTMLYTGYKVYCDDTFGESFSCGEKEYTELKKQQRDKC